MALAKEGYRSAVRGTAYASVPLNDDGYIASTTDTPIGTKNLQLTMVNAANSQEDNQSLTNIFLGFVDSYRQGSNYKMRVVWEV